MQEKKLGFIKNASERRQLEKREVAIRKGINKKRPNYAKIKTSRKKLRRLPENEIFVIRMDKIMKAYNNG